MYYVQVSFIERLNVLCPLFRVFFKRDSTVVGPKVDKAISVILVP